jgi:hypothetical protein
LKIIIKSRFAVYLSTFYVEKTHIAFQNRRIIEYFNSYAETYDKRYGNL